MQGELALESRTHGLLRAANTLRHLRLPLDSPLKLYTQLPDKCGILRPIDRKAVDLPVTLDTTLPVFHIVTRFAV